MSDISTGTVVSRDGTTIRYLLQGAGPAVVLVQGAMADVHAYRDLAGELSASFTVVSAERRGRGISPRPYTTDHDIARDVEDLDAIMSDTGATTLFGLSSGAVIVLEAARTLPNVERIAIFEPPFYEHGIDQARLGRLFDDIGRRRYGAALIGALLTSGTAPGFLARLPRPLGRVLGRMVLTVQAWMPGPGASLRQMLPGVRYDFHDVAEVDHRIGQYATVTRPVLLLSGTTSPVFLRDAVVRLGQLLPDAEHVELAGLGHDGPWNSGAPRLVAAELASFFAPAEATGDRSTPDRPHQSVRRVPVRRLRRQRGEPHPQETGRDDR